MMNQNSYQSERMLMRQREPETNTLEPPEITHESSMPTLESGGLNASCVVRTRNYYDTQKRAGVKPAIPPRLPQPMSPVNPPQLPNNR